MSEHPEKARSSSEPTAEELEEILADLDFFEAMEHAGVLPLDEEPEPGEEEQDD